MFYAHLSGFLSQKWVPKRWEPKGTQGSFRHVLPRNAIYNAMGYLTHGGIGLLLPATLSDLYPLYPLPRASAGGLVCGCIVRPLDLCPGVSLAVGQARPKSEPFCGL